MLVPPLENDPLVDDWYERHQDRFSFVLHIVGIPLMVLGIVLVPLYLGLLSFRLFGVALAAFVGGYILQFIGHLWDWTEPGELRLLRIWATKKLGRAGREVPAAARPNRVAG